MGEVYRATDTNLGRDVAIKVLPELFAQDADRLARFEREARTLASVNHPNIAGVHGLERSSGVALVMEFVEGPTLADRIAQGPIPWDEALPIATQIADALEAAHEQGIVHRDLKPANVKVRADGTVKVLDFGLAKAVDPASGSASGLSQSPTITSPAMTAAGVLLGTAAYMSPEQARARAVDKRTDIWAFGAVLYEMLTGRRAFEGEDVSDVLASVLAREPDWSALPAAAPPSAVEVIKRCLQKDRKQRFRDIGDVSLALNGAIALAPPTIAAPPAPTRSIWRLALPAAAAAIAAALVMGMAAWRMAPSAPARDITRFEFVPPDAHAVTIASRPFMSMAPDGRSFAYVGGGGMFIRPLGELTARQVDGVSGRDAPNGPSGMPGGPVVSPDGQWVAYFAGGQLMKVSVSGGTPTLLTAVAGSLGGNWSPDNSIIFGGREGIMRVPATGGAAELIVKEDGTEMLHFPQLLPGGRAVLSTSTSSLGQDRWNQAEIVAHSLTTGECTSLIKGGYHATYVSSGHLLYVQRGTLYGVGFDASKLAVTTTAVPVVHGLAANPGVGAVGATYSLADNGTLAYVAGGAAESQRALAWKTRGSEAAVPIASIPPGAIDDPRLSPDGSRVLVTRDGDLWIYELASGRSTRLTRDGVSQMGVWNPQGTRVAYSGSHGGSLEAWVTSSDGSGEREQVTTLGGQIHVDSWSPDGRLLTVHRHGTDGSVSIFMVPMDGSDRTPRPFLDPKIVAESASFSPDMKYVSYLTTESGQREIYIRPYPAPGGQVTVSVGGGREPKWMPNGEVFYRSIDGDRMFAVSASTVPALKIGPPVELFREPFYVAPSGSPRPQYDVTADGKRFLIITEAAATSTNRLTIVVVQNWIEELKRLLPVE